MIFSYFYTIYIFSGIKCIQIVPLSPPSPEPLHLSLFRKPRPSPTRASVPGNRALPFVPLCVWGLQAPHASGVVQYLLFCVWLSSLNTTFWRLRHVVACVRIPFLFKGE